MFRKTISILFLLAALTTAAFAQEGERMANPIRRALHPVESVELIPTDDGLELVIRGELPDGCDYPTVVNAEPVGVTWFIDLYRELPFDVMCPAVIKSYEERLDASFLLETAEGEMPATQIIVINGEIYGVEPTDARTFGAVLAVQFLIALVACGLPAWRAANVEPMRVLRDE